MKKIITIGCFVLFALLVTASSSGAQLRSSTVIAHCVEGHEASLAYAYESLFRTCAIWLKVKAVVEFTITGGGSVEDVKVLKTEGFDTSPDGAARARTLADKTTEAAYTWRFPKVESLDVTVDIPFLFVPVEGEEKEIAESEKPPEEERDYTGIRAENMVIPKRDVRGVYVFEEFIIECRRERAISFEVARARPEGDVFATAAQDKRLDDEAEKPIRDYLKEVAAYLDELSEGPASKLREKLASRVREMREVEAALADEELYAAVADLGLSKDYNWRIKKANAKKAAKLRGNQARLTAETETLREEVSTAEDTWARLLAEKWVALITRGEGLLSTSTLAEIREEVSTGENARARLLAQKWAAVMMGGEELPSTRTPEGIKPWLVFALAELNVDAGEGAKAAASFEQVLEAGELEADDEVLYGMARSYLLAKDDEKASKTFNRLTQEHPESRYAAEANFRLGEYFTSQLEPDKAEEYFLRASRSDAEYRDGALYGAAWGYYACSDPLGTTYYDRAVPAFKRFLDAAEDDSEYWEHVIEMTALCLAEWEPGTAERPAPLEALIRYDEAFGGAEERPYSADVLRALGDAYLYKMDKLPEAAAAYERLLEKYPFYEQAPAVAESLVDSLRRRDANDDAHDVRIRIVDEYGPASSWYRAQDEAGRCRALITWENALYEVGVYYNMLAERKSKIGPEPEEALILFDNAIKRYNQYLASFPTNEKAYHINFYLAESYYAVEDFETAAQQYVKTALHYTDRERYRIDFWEERGITQECALFYAIVAYGDLYDDEADASAGFLEPSARKLLATGELFLERFPESVETPEILKLMAVTCAREGDFERARQLYTRITEEYPDPNGDIFHSEKLHGQFYVGALLSIATTYLWEAEALAGAGDVNAADEKRAEYQAWYERAQAEAEKRNVNFEDIIEELE